MAMVDEDVSSLETDAWQVDWLLGMAWRSAANWRRYTFIK